MKKLTLTITLAVLALPASAAWKVTGTAPNQIVHYYYCGPLARIQQVDDAQRWRYRSAPITARLMLEDWARGAVVPDAPDCGAGRAALVISIPKAEADAIASDYDLGGASTPAQKADALDEEIRQQLLADEAAYKQHLAEQAAVPDPVDPLEDQ